MTSYLNNASANIEDFVGSTIVGGTAGSYKDANRIPMSFTSTKRLRKLNKDFSVTKITNTALTDQEVADLAEGFKNDRTQYELPIIQMAVNPNSISWKQPKRISKRDTQEGSIFFHFANARGQNNDILTLDFRGNTGNINRSSDTTTDGINVASSGGESTGATQKLMTWHNLWDLTREQILLDDNTLNEFLITYTSQIMPLEIMLIGFFSSTLEWTDNADKPNSRDYSFSFTVQKIVPDIDQLTKELTTYIINSPTT